MQQTLSSRSCSWSVFYHFNRKQTRRSMPASFQGVSPVPTSHLTTGLVLLQRAFYDFQGSELWPSCLRGKCFDFPQPVLWSFLSLCVLAHISKWNVSSGKSGAWSKSPRNWESGGLWLPEDVSNECVLQGQKAGAISEKFSTALLCSGFEILPILYPWIRGEKGKCPRDDRQCVMEGGKEGGRTNEMIESK